MTYESLKESGKVFNLQLSETVLRYYQVDDILINAHYYYYINRFYQLELIPWYKWAELEDIYWPELL